MEKDTFKKIFASVPFLSFLITDIVFFFYIQSRLDGQDGFAFIIYIGLIQIVLAIQMVFLKFITKITNKLFKINANVFLIALLMNSIFLFFGFLTR